MLRILPEDQERSEEHVWVDHKSDRDRYASIYQVHRWWKSSPGWSFYTVWRACCCFPGWTWPSMRRGGRTPSPPGASGHGRSVPPVCIRRNDQSINSTPGHHIKSLMPVLMERRIITPRFNKIKTWWLLVVTSFGQNSNSGILELYNNPPSNSLCAGAIKSRINPGKHRTCTCTRHECTCLRVLVRK